MNSMQNSMQSRSQISRRKCKMVDSISNNPMNFHPFHQRFDRFPSQNPPIYTSLGFEPRHSHQFHQPPNSHINPPPPPPYGYGGCSEDEQRLRDEVIYLHSLWRRGPPPFQNLHLEPLPTTLQIQNPLTKPLPTTPQIQNPYLKPLPTTPFKKKNKNKNKKKKPNKPQVVSDKEWPVDPKAACPSPPRQGWGEFKPGSFPISRPVTAEERRVLAVRVQLKGLDSFIGFFHKSDDDDDEEDDDYDEEEAFEFFLKVSEKDVKLREYYKTKCENGSSVAWFVG